MPRNGSLIIIGAVVIVAALGLFIWTKFIDVEAPSGAGGTSSPGQTQPIATAQNNDAKWIKYMTNVLAEGGLVATFGEANIKNWRIADGHRLERFSLEGGNVAFGRLSSSVERLNTSPTWPERGLSYAFPVEWSNNNKGINIEVGIVARSPTNNASEVLNFVYSTQQAGHSGWQIVGLTGSFELHTFQYVVPNIEEAYVNPPVVVVHADDTAQGRAVEILGIYVKRVQ
jgi:hypothetical protein